MTSALQDQVLDGLLIVLLACRKQLLVQLGQVGAGTHRGSAIPLASDQGEAGKDQQLTQHGSEGLE